MRDYLYFWHEPKERFVVVSGIHFKDVAPCMSRGGGLLMLRHQYEEAMHYHASGFDYVSGSAVEALCRENIYSWGDVCWADYAHHGHPPEMTKQDVAEVLYFGHRGEPFSDVLIPSLKNRFLASGHDDGWRLKIYYADWTDMAGLLSQMKWKWSQDDRARILAGNDGAVWVDAGGMTDEVATIDIDLVLKRRLPQC